MAVTTQDLLTKLSERLRDSTTGTLDTTKKISALNDALFDLQTYFNFLWGKRTTTINYFEDVFAYTAPTDYMEGIDLRLEENDFADNYPTFELVDMDALARFKGLGNSKSRYAYDVKDGAKYIYITHGSRKDSIVMHDMDSVTANGTWAVVAASDAVSLEADTVEYQKGSGSLKFMVDVSNSGNNYAAIENSTVSSQDLSKYNNTGSMLARVYIPSVTYVTGLTGRWGSSSSDYYEKAITTNAQGGALVAGWNVVKFDWETATTTGTPDDTAIDYLYLQLTYSASQADMSYVRFDHIVFALPEKLTLHYYTNYVAKDTSNTYIAKLTSTTTDQPLYSGLYDEFSKIHVEFALENLFDQMEQNEDSAKHEGKGKELLIWFKAKYPQNAARTVKQLRVRRSQHQL